MPAIYDVEGLSMAYAQGMWEQANQSEMGQVLFIRRAQYDFSVTGFNLTTVLSVICVSFAIFFSSPLFAFMTLVSLASRLAFMRHVDSLVACVDDTRAFLGLGREKWHPIETQILDFRVWMNWINI